MLHGQVAGVLEVEELAFGQGWLLLCCDCSHGSCSSENYSCGRPGLPKLSVSISEPFYLHRLHEIGILICSFDESVMFISPVFAIWMIRQLRVEDGSASRARQGSPSLLRWYGRSETVRVSALNEIDVAALHLLLTLV